MSATTAKSVQNKITISDFWSLAGIFNDSAIKDKPIDEVIELETKAAEKLWVEEAMPTFQMSKKTEENCLKALEDHRLGKTHEIKDADEFIDSLN